MPSVKDTRPQVMAAYRCESLLFREVGYPEDYAMPSHHHELAHLFFCLRGTVRHDCRKQVCLLAPSMLAFVPAGEPHANRFHAGVQTFDIVLQADWEARVRRASGLVDAPIDVRGGVPIWLAMRLYREFQDPDGLTPLVLEGVTLELMAHLSRDAASATVRDVPRWLAQARDFLHAHFTECSSLDTIAAAVGVHPAHLTRAFRQTYHDTIGDYVRRLRVESACHLLSATETPLLQIALDVGFADQAHFSRSFKRLTGMTPTAFRRSSEGAGLRQRMLP